MQQSLFSFGLCKLILISEKRAQAYKIFIVLHTIAGQYGKYFLQQIVFNGC